MKTRADGALVPASVTVAVCAQGASTGSTPCSPLVTLYSDATLLTTCSGTAKDGSLSGGTNCSNPLISDSKGNYHFYAPAGTYTLQVYGAGITTSVEPDITLSAVTDIRAFGAIADGAFVAGGCGQIAPKGCWSSPGNYGHANLLALQNAIAALPNGGTILYPNSGTNKWIIGSNADCIAAGGSSAGTLILPTDNITFQGQGQWATVLMMAPSTQCDMFVNSGKAVTGGQHVTFKDLRLDGNEVTDATHNDTLHPDNNLSTNASGRAFNWNAGVAAGVTRASLTLRNVAITGFVGDPALNQAVLIYGSNWVEFDNVDISFNQWARGLWFKTSDSLIIGLYMVYNGGWNGFENLVVQGGASNFFYGPYMGGGDGGASQIQLNATSANKFVGCIDDSANKIDLRLINSNQNMWINCQFTTPGQSGAAPTAFVNLEGTSSDNQFIGNQFGTTAYNIPQIREQDTAGNTYIYNNKFFATASGSALTLRAGGGSIAHDNSGNGVTDTAFNLLGSGTISAPEIAFNADSATGWYRRAANFWSWTTGGVENFYLGPQQVAIGNGGRLMFGSGDLASVVTDSGISREGAAILDIGNGNQGDKTGTLKGSLFEAKQHISDQGTACTNGELALSAGWQSTGSATVTAVAGNGQTCSWTITTGTTTAANPTITDTLTNALPAATTVCWMNIYGGTHTAVAGESLRQTTLSATAPIFTANFTPTAAGTTYFVTRVCGP